jgi:hypothetical protein
MTRDGQPPRPAREGQRASRSGSCFSILRRSSQVSPPPTPPPRCRHGRGRGRALARDSRRLPPRSRDLPDERLLLLAEGFFRRPRVVPFSHQRLAASTKPVTSSSENWRGCTARASGDSSTGIRRMDATVIARAVGIVAGTALEIVAVKTRVSSVSAASSSVPQATCGLVMVTDGATAACETIVGSLDELLIRLFRSRRARSCRRVRPASVKA